MIRYVCKLANGVYSAAMPAVIAERVGVPAEFHLLEELYPGQVAVVVPDNETTPVVSVLCHPEDSCAEIYVIDQSEFGVRAWDPRAHLTKHVQSIRANNSQVIFRKFHVCGEQEQNLSFMPVQQIGHLVVKHFDTERDMYRYLYDEEHDIVSLLGRFLAKAG